MGLIHCYMFINKIELDNYGIDIDKINCSSDLYNSQLDNQTNPIFIDREDIIQSEEFKKYDSDPNYIKKRISIN